MDFSLAGSDVWESTEHQDKFIENYFKGDNLKNQRKKSKSKKKNQVGSSNVLSNETISVTKPSGEKLLINNKNALSSPIQDAKHNVQKQTKKKTQKEKQLNKKDELSNKDALEVSNIKKQRRKRKKNKKLSAQSSATQDVELVSDTEKDNQEKIENNFNNSKTELKKAKKRNKKKSKSHKAVSLSSTECFGNSEEGQEQGKSKQPCESIPIDDSIQISSTSKKTTMQNSDVAKDISLCKPSNVDTSDSEEDELMLSKVDSSDSEDDELIRQELTHLSLFKKLQKISSQMTNYSSDDFDEEKSDDEYETISESEDSTNEAEEVDLGDLPLEQANKAQTSLSQAKTGMTETVNQKPVLTKAEEKLQAAKFRYLNEKLYTETGHESFIYFQDNISDYHNYHQGYSQQVQKWPMNPVDKIIKELQKEKPNTVVADLGCGDAKIAQALSHKLQVHSFDLVALNSLVNACDISKVPLKNESVDIVVFCLSLMGVNLKDYLCEAHRILKLGGILKIAEVESRVEDVNKFIRNLKPLGFGLRNQNLEHRIFIFFDFKKEKAKIKRSKVPEITLKACKYKKR